MANPRDALKNNPLKPKPVAIPQVDPFSEPAVKRTAEPKPSKVEKASENPVKPKREVVIKKETKPDAALYVTISKEDKKWLNYYRFDQGKTLNEVVTEAIELLRQNSK